MNLQNQNALTQINILKQNVVAPKPAVAIVKAIVSTDFHKSMVGRIHNVKPGCGSCGH